MDREELKRALAKLDVQSYLDREGVDYKHSYGTNGLQLNLTECPACHEGGRKTYINADTGLGNCFHGSCGFKFNKFWLAKHVSGLAGPALDAHIAAVAEEQGWVPKRARKTITRAELELPSKIHPVPIAGTMNLQYLKDRGITIATAEWFHLSYCNAGWWGYKIEDTQRWVSFDKRIIIPITDLDGKLVSFQGRTVDPEMLPKYLFPVGYAVAGSHLYNGHNFEEGRHRHAVVGEGAFDVFAIHQALEGHDNCSAMLPIATFGMHLSAGPEGQIAKFLRLKERGLTTVTFMWDAEKRATIAAVKAGLQLASLGLTVRLARLPAGKDPNEVAPEVVRQAIFKAVKLDRLSAIKMLSTA
jgi:DNA primase